MTNRIYVSWRLTTIVALLNLCMPAFASDKLEHKSGNLNTIDIDQLLGPERPMYEGIQSLRFAWKTPSLRHPDILFRIGRHYDPDYKDGFFKTSPKDGEKEIALKLMILFYDLAGQANHKRALCSLGYCFSKRIGLDQDEARSQEYDAKAAASYRKAAELGDPWGQNNLALCLMKGRGEDKDLSEAIRWLKLAANAGVPEAYNTLGRCFELGTGTTEDRKEAFQCYTKAAEKGHASAERNVGLSYEFGIGVDPDLKEATRWYEKAAFQGNRFAQYNLGLFYESGRGVPKIDKVKAESLYLQASKQGHKEAEQKLNALQDEFEKVRAAHPLPADFKDMSAVYELAIKGDEVAQTELGKKYSYNFSHKLIVTILTQNGFELKTEKDKELQKAIYWLGIPAEAGFAEAQRELGKLYFNVSFEKDSKAPDLALKWLNRAAEQKDSSAILELAERYRSGKGVPSDLDRSVELFKQAGLLGNTKALLLLAHGYATGQSTEIPKIRQDKKQTVELLRQAIRQGDAWVLKDFLSKYQGNAELGLETELKLLEEAGKQGDTWFLIASANRLINGSYPGSTYRDRAAELVDAAINQALLKKDYRLLMNAAVMLVRYDLKSKERIARTEQLMTTAADLAALETKNQDGLSALLDMADIYKRGIQIEGTDRFELKNLERSSKLTRQSIQLAFDMKDYGTALQFAERYIRDELDVSRNIEWIRNLFDGTTAGVLNGQSPHLITRLAYIFSDDQTPEALRDRDRARMLADRALLFAQEQKNARELLRLADWHFTNRHWIPEAHRKDIAAMIRESAQHVMNHESYLIQELAKRYEGGLMGAPIDPRLAQELRTRMFNQRRQ